MELTLGITELNQGRKKSIENAGELLEEAEILYSNNKHNRALYLSCIGNEEIGKYIFLSSMIIRVIYEKNIDWKKFWNKFRSHKEKSTILFVVEDVVFDLYGELEEEFIPEDESKIQEILKLSSLYSDYANNTFYKPSDMERNEITYDAIKLLRARVQHFKDNFLNTSTEEYINSLTKESISSWYSELGIKEK